MIQRLTPYPMRRCPVKWTINLRPDGLDSLSWGADTRVDSKMFSCLFLIPITFSWHFLFHSHQRFLRCATPAGTRCSFVSPQHFLPLLHFTFFFHLFHLNTSFILCKTNFIFRHLSCSTFHFHFWNLKPSLLRFTFVFSSKHFLPTLLFKKEIFMHLSFPFTFEFNTSASVFHFHFFHWNICSRFLHYIYLNTSFPLCLSLSLFISPRPPLPLTFTF